MRSASLAIYGIQPLCVTSACARCRKEKSKISSGRISRGTPVNRLLRSITMRCSVRWFSCDHRIHVRSSRGPLAGKFHDRGDAGLSICQINALSSDRCAHKAAHQIGLAREPIVAGDNGCLNILQVISKPKQRRITGRLSQKARRRA
jgi:hypothetical protein